LVLSRALLQVLLKCVIVYFICIVLSRDNIQTCNTVFLSYCFAGSYQPSHELMLRFYSYFKQATEGPCVAPRPAFWEVVKKMKWEAWNRLGNMSQEEAMNNYVEELKKVCTIMYNFVWTVINCINVNILVR
jgi:acyl-CoA-binding protein